MSYASPLTLSPTDPQRKPKHYWQFAQIHAFAFHPGAFSLECRAMPTIQIRRSHTKGLDAARAVAEEVAETLKDKIQADYHWAGNDLRFERKGAKGAIRVSDTEVEVVVDLSFVLRPLKKKIEGKIEVYLSKLD